MRKQLLLGFLSLLILISLLLGGCSPKPLYWGYIPHGLLTDIIIVCYSINYNEISQGKPLDVTLYFKPLDVYLNNPEAKTVCTVTMSVLDKQETVFDNKKILLKQYDDLSVEELYECPHIDPTCIYDKPFDGYRIKTTIPGDWFCEGGYRIYFYIELTIGKDSISKHIDLCYSIVEGKVIISGTTWSRLARADV